MIASPELHRTGASSCLGMGENVLEVPEDISIPLHVKIQVHLCRLALDLAGNFLQGRIAFAQRKGFLQACLLAIAVDDAVLVFATSAWQHRCDKVLVVYDGEGYLLERSEGELVV